ncbi:MAG TPA: glycosyltransferase [Thermoplasmata archaeon]|nr:glycosyltransferase [Thermoplasmata archaeon]
MTKPVCADRLEVGLIVPNIDAYSGAVHRTVKLLEHGGGAGLHHTVLLPSAGAPNPALGRELARLEAAGTVDVRRIGRGGREPLRYDAVSVPTEYWWGAYRRAQAAGVRGPLFFDFHLLPYVGSLDVLQSVGIDRPGRADLWRLPFAMHDRYREGLARSARETLACLASVRALSRWRLGPVLGISGALARQLAAVGYKDDVYVPGCPNGIEADAVQDAAAVEGTREYDGIFVGRFHPQKGFLDLPGIVARMKRASGREVRIAVCGGSPDPSSRFGSMARAHGIERNLEFLGQLPVPELYAAIRRARVLLYPSYVDSFSLTILEALCLGVPVLAYDTEVVRDLWSPSPAVFRVPIGSPEGFAETFAELDADSRLDEARRAAVRDAPRLMERFSWSHAAADQRTFYEETRYAA